MDRAAVAAVLDALAAGGVPVWVEGGWGVDALLGEQTRAHEDLDLAVEHADVGRARAALSALGFRHDPAIRPGLPARLVLVGPEGRQVDLHPIVLDERGDGWQPLADGGWGAYPADGLAGAGVIAGRGVRCLTPRLQLRHHLGYPPDDRDRHDLRLLAERFGLELPPALGPP